MIVCITHFFHESLAQNIFCLDILHKTFSFMDELLMEMLSARNTPTMISRRAYPIMILVFLRRGKGRQYLTDLLLPAIGCRGENSRTCTKSQPYGRATYIQSKETTDPFIVRRSIRHFLRGPALRGPLSPLVRVKP